MFGEVAGVLVVREREVRGSCVRRYHGTHKNNLGTGKQRGILIQSKGLLVAMRALRGDQALNDVSFSSMLSTMEYTMPGDAMVALDCPKLANGYLKFAKCFHMGDTKQIYHALLQQSLMCKGGIVYNEILCNNIALPLPFDVELKRLTGFSEGTFQQNHKGLTMSQVLRKHSQLLF